MRLRLLPPVLLGGLLVFLWTRPGPPAPVRVEVRPERGRSPRQVRLPRPEAHRPDAVEPTPPETWFDAVETVQAGCGLQAEPWCDGSGCAVVLESPDLDSALGWATMTLERPWFVANVLGRDLGLGSTPCASALALTFADGVRAVEPHGEREVWCAGRAPSDALCDRAAAAVLGRRVHFADSERTLRFTP